MKTYRALLLKSLGLTAGLNGILLLFLYAASPIVKKEIGQAALFGATTLLLIIATCLYARIRADKRRSLWLCFAVSLPLHLILSVVSVLVYGNRLSSFWAGGSNLAWLLFLLLSVAAWTASILTMTVVKTAYMSLKRREEKKQAKRIQQGFRLEVSPLSPARARLLAVFKGVLWVLWLHVLTGLLLEGLTAMGVANTILAYVVFPCLWCLMAAAYGLLIGSNRRAFARSVTVTHLVCFAFVMLFLLPGNIPEHPYYAVKYLDDFITSPFDSPELILILILFVIVWTVMLLFSVTHRKAKSAHPPAGEAATPFPGTHTGTIS